MEGVGKYHFSSGDVYVGQFYFDHPHGDGSAAYTDGSTYVGSFREGVPSGRGTMTTTYPAEGGGQGERCWTGQWRSGKRVHGTEEEQETTTTTSEYFKQAEGGEEEKGETEGNSNPSTDHHGGEDNGAARDDEDAAVATSRSDKDGMKLGELKEAAREAEAMEKEAREAAADIDEA